MTLFPSCKKYKKIHLSDQILIYSPFDFSPPFFSAVDYFKDDYVSENVLKKLIRQNVVEEVVKKETSEQFLFRENVPCDYFILILQGMLAIGKSVELRFLTPSDLSAIFLIYRVL